MGNYVFANSTKLIAIEVDDANSAFKDIDGVLFNKSGTILYAVPAGNARTTYAVPNSVTTIYGRAMPYCSKLTNIDIPSSVTSIGSNTFNNCTNLLEILIHKSTNAIAGAKWGAPATTIVRWSP
jgi:methylthioribose-1-phosphate isomerase